MINVRCTTNLDLLGEEWPRQLPCLPNVGNEIESKTHHGGFRLSLQVVGIRWRYSPYSETTRELYQNERWVAEIELHMTSGQKMIHCIHDGKDCSGSIRAFYEWYAPKVGRTVGSFI